jgi:hypothetical protein
MGRGTRTSLALLGAAVAVLCVGTSSASATFHEMRIRAIFEGPSGGGTVELQMLADGQNFTSGQTLDIYNNVNNLKSSFVLPGVANGINQRTILISDNAALSPDVNTGGGLHTALQTNPGALCYSGIDCVSWGAFTNNAVLPSPAGTPLSGLSTSQVVSRTIARGCPTALDTADDTDNSAADFSFGIGFPFRNNSAAATETLCPTTGNPNSPTNPAGNTRKRKCKKPKSSGGNGSAYAAKHKKCRKRK